MENGAVADDLVLSPGEARRLAVRSQRLARPPPAAGIDGMRQVLRVLRVLQLAGAGSVRYAESATAGVS